MSPWKKLHGKFLALAAEESRASDAPMQVHGVYDESAGPYGLWCLDCPHSEMIREQFLMLATEAGMIHGPPITGWLPYALWLHWLLNFLRMYNSTFLSPEPVTTATIVRAIEASAMYCARLHTQSLEAKVALPFPSETELEARMQRIRASRINKEEAPPAPVQPKGQPDEIPPVREYRPSGQIHSLSAAQHMKRFIEDHGLTQPKFADLAQTTDRTIRSFGKTGRVRKDIFRDIASAMGTTPEELLNRKVTGK